MQFTMLALPFLFNADPERLDLRGGWAVVKDGVVQEVHWDAPPVPPKPEEWQVPDGFTRYASARYTQEIAVTNNRDRISAVPRRRLEEKWRTPGGLVGVSGWTSELYKNPGPDGFGIYGVYNLQVWNGESFQPNRGYARTYYPGAQFIEVLKNSETGKPFEVRHEEAVLLPDGKGKMNYTVSFRDASQRPKGYKPVSLTECAACHQPPPGNYANGLPQPAQGGTFSDPVPELERAGAGLEMSEPQAAARVEQRIMPIEAGAFNGGQPESLPLSGQPPVFVRQFAPRGRSGC